MQEIRFLSTLIPDQMQKEVNAKSSGNMSDAAQALQMHLYEGLSYHYDSPISMVNVLPVGSYPQYYTDAFIKEKIIDFPNGAVLNSIGFCNIKLIRKYIIPRKVFKALLDSFSDIDEGFLYIYTASASFMTAVKRFKKKKPGIKTCVIIADLPNMSNLSSKKSLIQKVFEQFLARKAVSYLDVADAYVLLTSQMAEYLGITKPYCIVEGISTDNEEFGLPSLNANKVSKIVFYSGTLHRRFGIINLIKAFEIIPNKNYRLIICGIGDSEKEIIEETRRDERIQFLGKLPREKVLELQNNATVLVNPRQNIEEYTKYSFPSKTMEYLSSGKPVISYKLDGIPDEYDDYLFYVNDNSVQALSEKIMEVCEMNDDELIYAGMKGKEFVIKQKNSIVQTRKIVDMMNSL